ncbi:MFS transporter [Actinomadura rubrisoli]|uniref:MFS transporter n=1 Tax=Actinomadura rubrisoli TaxID=2530368 RepID=A0A4V2YRG3_9ACTN|nr:MFS transporter [Actinomadura rubrisoli]TDD66077.1 MFS transporter [Actinomadura rubrisoli]
MPKERALQPSTLVFALGTFAAGTDAFIIAAFLPKMAQDLGASEAATGQSVTAFSIAYALLCPVLATLTARVPRRTLLISGLAVLMAGNVLAAFSPNLTFLMVARVLAAAGAAAYTPSSFAVAAGLVRPEYRGRALSVVIGGLTIATAVGVPLGALMSRSFGWRTALIMVAVLCAIACAGVRVVMPRMPGAEPVPLRRRLAPLRRWDALQVLTLTILGMGGSYTVYSYAATALEPTGVGSEWIGLMMFLYGAGAVLGNFASGTGTDRYGPRAILTAGYTVQVVALGLLGVLAVLRPSAGPATLVGAGTLVLLWGGATWTQTPPQNNRLIQRFGPADAPLVVSLNSSAIYAGIALGSGIGGVVLNARPGAAVYGAATVIEVLALLLLLLTASSFHTAKQHPAETPAEPSVKK